ncbi:hypothetical protein [Mesobacillus subterraneus]|uniref:Uncharacterized protein n=1 Tax=Mesobacillus subterraneus TaxID=285983 RepID=A0A427TNV8_9BACI|nr:hypothetical protein [Mesobacillus subterraneus]RSD26044.1 hypothetical protein EJA10_14515 [Mesobacillus subterraneus]
MKEGWLKMEEVIKSTDNLIFTTSTAEVKSPDDFLVEFLVDLPNQEQTPVKVRNVDELMDFLDKMDW